MSDGTLSDGALGKGVWGTCFWCGLMDVGGQDVVCQGCGSAEKPPVRHELCRACRQYAVKMGLLIEKKGFVNYWSITTCPTKELRLALRMMT